MSDEMTKCLIKVGLHGERKFGYMKYKYGYKYKLRLWLLWGSTDIIENEYRWV